MSCDIILAFLWGLKCPSEPRGLTGVIMLGDLLIQETIWPCWPLMDPTLPGLQTYTRARSSADKTK